VGQGYGKQQLASDLGACPLHILPGRNNQLTCRRRNIEAASAGLGIGIDDNEALLVSQWLEVRLLRVLLR